MVRMEIVADKNNLEIPVADLQNGNYLLTWRQGNVTRHQKIQVIH